MEIVKKLNFFNFPKLPQSLSFLLFRFANELDRKEETNVMSLKEILGLRIKMTILLR
jgi:hypothetical protein